MSAILLAIPAYAAEPGLYPAAQCAGLWHGYVDYAEITGTIDADPEDRLRAEAFRAVAHRQGDPVTVDAFIAAQRQEVIRLLDAYIYGRDKQSEDLFVSVSETCDHFGRTQPETRHLQ